VSPSSAAFTSLITTSAAAPSFRGQQFPAVTVPCSRNTGLSEATLSRVVPGRGPSSAETTEPSGSVTGLISRCQKAVGERLLREVLRPDTELVLLGPRDAAQRGEVLGRLAHRDVNVGHLAVLARVVPWRLRRRRRIRPRLGVGEQRIVRVGQAVA